MSASAPRQRDPDATRSALLQAAFEEIYAAGFRAASLESILARTGVTKGALYHHFPNKQALGHAVVEEVLLPRAIEDWGPLLDDSRNPVDALIEIFTAEKTGRLAERLRMGCPVNNLVQEMAGLDEGFRARLAAFQQRWIRAIEKALLRGIEAGQVRGDVAARQAATLIVAGYEGCAGIAKCHRDAALYAGCVDSIIEYLEGLRA